MSRLFAITACIVFNISAQASFADDYVPHQNLVVQDFSITNRLPQKDEILVEHSPSTTQEFSSTESFSVLVWNIYKAKRSGLVPALKELSQQHDISLLQESIFIEPVLSIFSQLGRLGWLSAISFFNNNDVATGVSNSSRYKTTNYTPIVSIPREPFIRTPKMILAFEVPIAGQQDSVLVTNMHAINFVSTRSFKKHVDQLVELIEVHRGPIVSAGDYNTWNNSRMTYLDDSLEQHGLTRATLLGDSRGMKLDHIYTRGLIVENAELLNDYNQSDHTPISGNFSLSH